MIRNHYSVIVWIILVLMMAATLGKAKKHVKIEIVSDTVCP